MLATVITNVTIVIIQLFTHRHHRLSTTKLCTVILSDFRAEESFVLLSSLCISNAAECQSYQNLTYFDVKYEFYDVALVDEEEFPMNFQTQFVLKSGKVSCWSKMSAKILISKEICETLKKCARIVLANFS